MSQSDSVRVGSLIHQYASVYTLHFDYNGLKRQAAKVFKSV